MPVVQNIDHKDFGNLLRYRLKDMGMKLFHSIYYQKDNPFQNQLHKTEERILIRVQNKDYQQNNAI